MYVKAQLGMKYFSRHLATKEKGESNMAQDFQNSLVKSAEKAKL